MGAVVLDAHVLIALAAPEDAHHPVAAAALQRARGEGSTFLVPMSAYSECLVGPFRHGHAAVSVVEEFIDTLPAHLVPVSRAIGRAAAQLRARHGRALKLPDALVVATAELAEASVMTTDAEWPKVGVPVIRIG